MSLFSRLFGAKETSKQGAPAQEPVEHKGYAIYPEPIKDGGQWRVAARIQREVGGETLTHQLIRADTLESQQAAADASLDKARQMIDEQGDGIFR